MAQQASVRRPDETICLRCGTTIKRDVRICPECGTQIAAGPLHTVEAPGYGAAASRAVAAEDVVGAGRYILNFILAGFVGLGLTYSSAAAAGSRPGSPQASSSSSS